MFNDTVYAMVTSPSKKDMCKQIVSLYKGCPDHLSIRNVCSLELFKDFEGSRRLPSDYKSGRKLQMAFILDKIHTFWG